MNIGTVIRQGDVLLVRVRALPKEAVEVPTVGAKLVLALGEATGHHHRFEFRDTAHDVKMFHAGGARYVQVLAPAQLLHEEHSPARVEPGVWLVPSQVEYTPAEPRRVAD